MKEFTAVEKNLIMNFRPELALERICMQTRLLRPRMKDAPADECFLTRQAEKAYRNGKACEALMMTLYFKDMSGIGCSKTILFKGSAELSGGDGDSAFSCVFSPPTSSFLLDADENGVYSVTLPFAFKAYTSPEDLKSGFLTTFGTSAYKSPLSVKLPDVCFCNQFVTEIFDLSGVCEPTHDGHDCRRMLKKTNCFFDLCCIRRIGDEPW